MPNINRFTNKVFTQAAESLSHTKIAKTAAELASEARELEMIPKVLTLQTVTKGAQTVDRFSQEEISAITKLFKSHETNMSKYDLMKELVNIGSSKGEPLSFQHISDFLGTTSSMSENQLKNVLKYMRAASEDIDFVQNATKYNDVMHNVRRADALGYISQRHPEFVEVVSKAKDPETLAHVVNEVGVNQVVTCAPDALTDVCTVSGRNLTLIKDLTRAFYPSEVKEIAAKLAERLKTGKLKDLSKYTSFTYEPHQVSIGITPSLATQRKSILNALDLTGEIKLLPLRKKEPGVFGNPHVKIVYGFESGKRR